MKEILPAMKKPRVTAGLMWPPAVPAIFRICEGESCQ